MEPAIRLIHWYDTERHRVACGAPGQSNSTKHRRGVTCAACLTCLAGASSRTNVTGIADKWVQ